MPSGRVFSIPGSSSMTAEAVSSGFAAGVDIMTVANDDTIEVPGEDFLYGSANGRAVAHEKLAEARGRETTPGMVEFHQPGEEPVAVRAEIEREIGDDEAAAGTVKKDDLVELRHSGDEVLLDDAGPIGRWSVTQWSRNEADVAT